MRSLLVDCLLLAVVASARVIIERLRGLVHGGSDLLEYFLPNFHWWWSAPHWLSGWNPWLFAGYPASGDPQLSQYHPFGVLYAVLAPLDAAAIEGALAPAAAAIGMLIYLRQIGCGRAGALIGGLSFGLGGFITGHAPHSSVVRAALPIPWALAAIEALDGKRLVVALAAAVWAILVSGHPQVMMYSLVLVLAYGVLQRRKAGVDRSVAIAAAFVLGIGVAAPALLPAFELIRQSTRSWPARAAGILDPDRLGAQALAGLFAPFVGGGSVGPFYGNLGLRTIGNIETAGYPGMLVLVLVIAGVPALLRSRRGRFWLALAAISIAVGSGSVGALLPIRGVRAPARLLLWWNTAMAACVGVVLSSCRPDEALDPGDPRDRASLPASLACWLASGLIAAVLAAAWWCFPLGRRAVLASSAVLAIVLIALIVLRRRRADVAWPWLVALAGADLILFAASFPLGIPPGQVAEIESVLQAIRGVRPEGTTDHPELTRRLVASAFLGVNWASVTATPMLQGYTSLVPLATADLLGLTASSPLVEKGAVTDRSLASPKSHVLDLLRCGLYFPRTRKLRVVDPLGRAIESVANAGSRRWSKHRIALESPSRFFTSHQVVFANRQVLPVAWLVRGARAVSPQRALQLVRGVLDDDDFDPATEALTTTSIAGLPPLAPGPLPADPLPRVDVLSYGEDEIRLTAAPPVDALLVTSELWYPGWVATVDEKPATVHVVNAGFRAVVVPRGAHTIVFAYRPPLVRRGLGLATLCLAALVVLTMKRARPSPPTQPVASEGEPLRGPGSGR